MCIACNTQFTQIEPKNKYGYRIASHGLCEFIRVSVNKFSGFYKGLSLSKIRKWEFPSVADCWRQHSVCVRCVLAVVFNTWKNFRSTALTSTHRTRTATLLFISAPGTNRYSLVTWLWPCSRTSSIDLITLLWNRFHFEDLTSLKVQQIWRKKSPYLVFLSAESANAYFSCQPYFSGYLIYWFSQLVDISHRVLNPRWARISPWPLKSVLVDALVWFEIVAAI